jgi:Uma2 family endonuclease
MVLAEPQTSVRLTYDQFEAFLTQPEHADRRFELINGEIIEKNLATEEHGTTAVEMIYALRRFLETHPIGRLMTEVLHLHPADPNNARQPDISFTLKSS